MRRKIEGAGLIAAIALIVVVAVLVLAITRTVQFGAENLGIDVLDQRALLAAQSGAQLGLNRIFAPQGVGSCANMNFDLSGLPGLNICTTQVACTSVVVRSEPYYTIESTGTCATGDLQATRSVRVRAR
jgi:MSHA biogenesis protein MshP